MPLAQALERSGRSLALAPDHSTANVLLFGPKLNEEQVPEFGEHLNLETAVNRWHRRADQCFR